MTDSAATIITPELLGWIGRQTPLRALEVISAADVRRYVDATGDANLLWVAGVFLRQRIEGAGTDVAVDNPERGEQHGAAAPVGAGRQKAYSVTPLRSLVQHQGRPTPLAIGGSITGVGWSTGRHEQYLSTR